MKICPACRTNYTDDSLRFCLADGTALHSILNNGPTAGGPAPKSSSAFWIKIVLAAVALGVVAIGAFGLLGAFFFYGTATKENEVTLKSPTPVLTVTPDNEKEILRDRLANIQKRLDEQKKTDVNSYPASPDEPKLDSIPTATVNSPNDGFLALRSKPDANRGDLIVKIPHGAKVELNNCEKSKVKLSGRTGRWCQVEYNGMTGWVFDVWLNY